MTVYEVIIVGGSYAGLAAAMTLGRSLRKVLVIDSGDPCNEQTPHSHNFITQDGSTPKAIADRAKSQVLKYKTVTFQNDLVTRVEGLNQDFVVTTISRKQHRAKKLIFATGIKDMMPNISGFSDCWGITAIHCPYCHGYEVRSKNTGILVNNEGTTDFAKLVLNWTDKLTVYTNGEAEFDIAEVQRLGVAVVEKEIQNIEHINGSMQALRFKDGTKVSIEALYHRAKYGQHCKIPQELGCELTETGHIRVNDFQQSNIPGVYVVGDATTPFRAVSVANASGTKAGAVLNHELITESYQ